MNITFLVGNGFDISIGVPTSYKNFFKWYCEQSPKSESIKQFKEHIKTQQNEYWSDLEEGLGKYTSHFTKENVDDFFECYTDIQQSLLDYIEYAKNGFDFDGYTDEECRQFSNALLSLYSELNPKEKSIIAEIFEKEKPNGIKLNFINFNYTDCLDYFVKRISNSPLATWQTSNGNKRQFTVNPNVIHIHGTTATFPLLGVDNENQISNKDLLNIPRFKDILIKPQSVEAIGQLWHSDATKTIENSRIICIFGMSLGITDGKWWTKILNWLNQSDSRQLILFWHCDNPPASTDLFGYLSTVDQVKEKLLSFTNNSRDKFQNRIHVIINTKKVLQLPTRKKYDIAVNTHENVKELITT